MDSIYSKRDKSTTLPVALHLIPDTHIFLYRLPPSHTSNSQTSHPIYSSLRSFAYQNNNSDICYS